MSEDFKEFLGLLGNPPNLGIVLFDEYDEKQLKSYFDDSDKTLCQVMKEAIDGKIIARNLDSFDKCTIGNFILGSKNLPDDLAGRWQKELNLKPDVVKKMIDGFKRFKDKPAKYVLFGPTLKIVEMKIIPHTVILYVNSDQIHILNSSFFDITGEQIISDFNGHASCQIIPATMIYRRPWIAFPCMGARRLANSGTNEIWFGAHYIDLMKIYQRMKISGIKYPITVKGENLLPLLGRNPVPDLEDLVPTKPI